MGETTVRGNVEWAIGKGSRAWESPYSRRTVDTTCICAGTVAAKFVDYVSNFIIILHPILD